MDDGTVLGKIFGGQVLPEKPKEDRYRETARAYGIDEEEYLRALHLVNIRTQEEIESASALLANVINMFVRTSYQAWMNAASLSERSHIISSLSKIYFCNYYISVDEDTFMEIDAPEDLHQYGLQDTKASVLLKQAAAEFAEPEYEEEFRKFNDLYTLKQRMHHKQNISYEFECRDSGWCRAVFILVSSDENGEAGKVIYALQYIQEEKEKELETQQKLRKSAEEAIQANNAKSEFLSRISHDIRTPMNGIIGMTRIAMEQENNPATIDCLKKIDTSSSYLLGLINDVLDMSRIESGQIVLYKEPYPVEEFRQYMDSVLRPLAEAKHQNFIFNVNVSEEYIPIQDKLRINQVVFNLVSNAIKYTNEGGTVEYSVDELMQGSRMLMKIVVKDNGRGMSEEFQKVLFQPYTQEDRVRSIASVGGGSGLGLAIVKRLVTLMDGTISVSSKVNVGSTFEVQLPVECITVKEYQAKRNCFHPDDDEALRGKKILVCEDNHINQEIAMFILKRYGIQADMADDGLIGKNMFSGSMPGTYYAVLMDLRMPLMDGYETTQAIRALPREDAKTIPIIAMTADVFEEDIAHCRKVGMNDHIAKPLEPNALYERLLRFQKK